jgi:hypothetical protein
MLEGEFRSGLTATLRTPYPTVAPIHYFGRIYGLTLLVLIGS